ncbi:thioesterase [Actibacterium mucosum KCTC 23349]|uniref:Thioesterase n=1 Tax=Actibacterium mucosum KCTC 23349 TaxID=1454373 RepID=A0A037ZER6_9RHOB|nr:tol-pal system-associated acyl-CoA thioesterase [Actibacterium mucosum]KAJ54108.1 thioesterase [Actibacterium mucosum KCTC 23349]
MTHQLPVRVYYEDTDLAGIVYYANYLKFIERGRSEWVRALGVDQAALQRQGLVFAVRRVAADYLSSARYDDLLDVRTELLKVGGASLMVRQGVWRGDTQLFRADVTVAMVNENGRPARIPADIRRLFGQA